MSSGEIAALITAIGISSAAILTAIAALINARNSASRVEILQTQIKELQTNNEMLRADNTAKTEHNEIQDRVIFAQSIKISKWYEWGQQIGRALNEQQLIIGALEGSRQSDKKWTAPLPPLSEPKQRDDK